jgi:hypothetical protein
VSRGYGSRHANPTRNDARPIVVPIILAPVVSALRYNPLMPNQNPLAGVVPQVVHPKNDGETYIAEYIEQIEGEVALDSYVTAQTSAPEVVKRITKLETAYSTSPTPPRHPSISTRIRNCELPSRKQNWS